jgi:hypothetical protein
MASFPEEEKWGVAFLLLVYKKAITLAKHDLVPLFRAD